MVGLHTRCDCRKSSLFLLGVIPLFALPGGCGFSIVPDTQAAPIGSGLGGAGLVYSLWVDGEDLFAAGSSVPSGVASWNGTMWTSFDSSATNFGGAAPICVCVVGGTIYVGGQFSLKDTAGTEISKNIARWNGASWEAVGGGIDGRVNTMTAFNGDLIAGGAFAKAGGVTATNVARWNGVAWSALSTGLDGEVDALTVFDSKLIAAGNLPTYSFVASYNGTPWSRLGGPGTNGPSGRVRSLAVFNNELYVGGSFDKVQGTDAKNVGKWTGGGWLPVGQILGGEVNALAVHGGALYAGGNFNKTDAGDCIALARWDGALWQPVGQGVRFGGGLGFLRAITDYKGKLITAGLFSTANGQSVTNIAQWSP